MVSAATSTCEPTRLEPRRLLLQGCASSSSVKDEEKGAAGVAATEEKNADQKPVEPGRKLGNPAGAVSSTRARRLSNVMAQNADSGKENSNAVPPPITASSKDTRARRLSYVTNDVSSMHHDNSRYHCDTLTSPHSLMQ
jgi:hypothetical protein